ncbi:MAG: LLM class flavin-dependent oxidoreductase [Hahellaceae bacterium]|nr:LLM class flavin-dependent oxidoreductase [Hahellaceae bacterium]
MLDYVKEAEALGVDAVWTTEAWGRDAFTPLAFIAAHTERIKLGTGIAQISARTPSMTAMSALTMASLSNDRFLLGLGVSGPQVAEGIHGTSFAQPLSRLKETVELVRMAFAGETLVLQGKHYKLPLPDGEGKALRLDQAPNAEILIYLATIGTSSLEFTGAVADGWLGAAFTPECSSALLDPIRSGASGAQRSIEELDLQAGGTVAFGEITEPMKNALKASIAFTMSAMGSTTTNFYSEAFRRGGWSDTVQEVQRRWFSGDRAAAARAVPDCLMQQTNLIGSTADIAGRIRAYSDSGITTLRLRPYGSSLKERLEIWLKKWTWLIHTQANSFWEHGVFLQTRSKSSR